MLTAEIVNFLVLLAILSLLISSVLIIYAGGKPLESYYYILKGSWGSKFAITETLVKAGPLLLTGLAASLAFNAKFWNIGMEGQLYAGAIATTWIGITFTTLPSYILIPFIIISSFIAGGLWGLLAGYLKVKFNANEVVTTIMLNYIMINIVGLLVHGPWKNPKTMWPSSPIIAKAARFPLLVRRSRLHIGVLIAFIAAIIIYILLKRMVIGYRIRAVGASPKASEYGGIDVNKIFLFTILISGGLAGLAGAGEVASVQKKLIEGLSPGYGYAGVVVGLLGRLHPIGVILSAIFFASLITGTGMMQRLTGVPVALTYAVQGITLITILALTIFSEYQIRIVKVKSDEVKK
ncbi:MAG TPA: ABC transporter permease [Candidatus Atribacteria bacterium]|nr:ABC transporter permease [Candidatus Atribacteria bacterium]